MEKQSLVESAKKIFTGKKAKRNILIITILLAAIGFIYYKTLGNTTATTYEYAKATVKDIKKTVEGSGKVVSVSELDIQQLSGGKVTAVYVKPGDYVKKGQIIAQLDNRQASIQLTQAKASYDKIVNGSTKEDLDISNQSVVNAKQSYEITRQQQETAIANAKRTLLNTSITPVPVYDSRIQPNAPTISGSYICENEVEYTLKVMSSDFVSVSSSDNSTNGQLRLSSVPQAIGSCGLYASFDISKDYSNGEWKVTLPNKISSSYSTNLNAYNNAIIARDQALLNASTSIVNAQLSLNQKVVGARPEDIASAKASLASANLNYENTIIRAPFDGQIGAVSAAVGQQTSTQQGVATIITKDKIAEISLNEIDVVNVKLGQDVELTFDAIPDEVFKGSVSQINTVGQVVSNVVSFAVKISIPNADERIKSGMSVTANIITDEKKNILTVPSATIKTEKINNEEKSYVLKKVGATSENFRNSSSTIPVSTTASTTGTGSRGFNRNRSGNVTTGENQKVYVTVGISNDIDTEIVQDENNKINEGDLVVLKTNAGTVTTQTQSAFSLFGGGVRPQGGGGNFNRTNIGTTNAR